MEGAPRQESSEQYKPISIYFRNSLGEMMGEPTEVLRAGVELDNNDRPVLRFKLKGQEANSSTWKATMDSQGRWVADPID